MESRIANGTPFRAICRAPTPSEWFAALKWYSTRGTAPKRREYVSVSAVFENETVTDPLWAPLVQWAWSRNAPRLVFRLGAGSTVGPMSVFQRRATQ